MSNPCMIRVGKDGKYCCDVKELHVYNDCIGQLKFANLPEVAIEYEVTCDEWIPATPATISGSGCENLLKPGHYRFLVDCEAIDGTEAPEAGTIGFCVECCKIDDYGPILSAQLQALCEKLLASDDTAANVEIIAQLQAICDKLLDLIANIGDLSELCTKLEAVITSLEALCDKIEAGFDNLEAELTNISELLEEVIATLGLICEKLDTLHVDNELICTKLDELKACNTAENTLICEKLEALLDAKTNADEVVIWGVRTDENTVDNHSIGEPRPDGPGIVAWPQDDHELTLTLSDGSTCVADWPRWEGVPANRWLYTNTALAAAIATCTGKPWEFSVSGPDGDPNTAWGGHAASLCCPGDAYVVSATAKVTSKARNGRVIPLATTYTKGEVVKYKQFICQGEPDVWMDMDGNVVAAPDLTCAAIDCNFESSAPACCPTLPDCTLQTFGPLSDCDFTVDPPATLATDIYVDVETCDGERTVLTYVLVADDAGDLQPDEYTVQGQLADPITKEAFVEPSEVCDTPDVVVCEDPCKNISVYINGRPPASRPWAWGEFSADNLNDFEAQLQAAGYTVYRFGEKHAICPPLDAELFVDGDSAGVPPVEPNPFDADFAADRWALLTSGCNDDRRDDLLTTIASALVECEPATVGQQVRLGELLDTVEYTNPDNATDMSISVGGTGIFKWDTAQGGAGQDDTLVDFANFCLNRGDDIELLWTLVDGSTGRAIFNSDEVAAPTPNLSTNAPIEATPFGQSGKVATMTLNCRTRRVVEASEAVFGLRTCNPKLESLLEQMLVKLCSIDESLDLSTSVPITNCVRFDDLRDAVYTDFDSLSFVDGPEGPVPSFTITINEDIPVGSNGTEIVWTNPVGTTVDDLFGNNGAGMAEQLQLLLIANGYPDAVVDVTTTDPGPVTEDAEYAAQMFVGGTGIQTISYNIDGADWSQNGAVIVPEYNFGVVQGTRYQSCVDGVVVKEWFTNSVGDVIPAPAVLYPCPELLGDIEDKLCDIYDVIAGECDDPIIVDPPVCTLTDRWGHTENPPVIAGLNVANSGALSHTLKTTDTTSAAFRARLEACINNGDQVEVTYFAAGNVIARWSGAKDPAAPAVTVNPTGTYSVITDGTQTSCIESGQNVSLIAPDFFDRVEMRCFSN